MKQRNVNCKRILAMLLALVMFFTNVPITALASGTEVAVKDNIVDLTDNKFVSLSSFHATVTGIEITGADVSAASQDGANIYITMSSATPADANLTAKFHCTTNKFTVSQSVETFALENGEAELSIKLSGKYNGRIERGTYTYNLYFTTEIIPTEVPECIKETDTVDVYAGNAVQLNLKEYFNKATEYYLVEDGVKTKLEGNNYNFISETAGTYTLTFAAANNVGESPKYVVVTVNVKEITSGIYINKQSTNGSLNFITFTDTNGDYIEGVICELDGNSIRVTLPKSYDPTGKVKANFNLTQNSDGVPFVTTKTGTAGTTSGRAWEQRTTVITSTLSGGAAKQTFYYYNVKPTTTNNKYDTFTIEYKMKNELPVLVDQTKTEEAATIMAGESYNLNLYNLFSDADGDQLTYYVRINGGEKIVADADYGYSTNTAGEYELVFTAHDGKGESVDSYTIKLTVDNVKTKDVMTVKVPEGLSPKFYVTNGFTDGTDTLGEPLTAEKKDTLTGYEIYSVSYPQNAEYVSLRTEKWGGLAFSAKKDGTVSFSKVKAYTTDLSGTSLEATVTMKYGSNVVAVGTEGYLGVAEQTYSFTATPKDSDYVTKTQEVTVEETTDVINVDIKMGYKSPKTITVPTGATAQLFAYNKYYDFTEIKAKAVVDNGDGTSTFFFITTKSNLSYRASMDGKVTEAGYWTKNMTINFDDGRDSSQSNSSIEDNSVLVNVNSQNHLKLNTGDSYKLKGYRAWEIIKFSYQNEIITPDFNFEIISGNDVVSLTPAESKSNGGAGVDSDWMTVTALKPGTAIIEVSYDAIDIVEGSWPGLYKKSDENRNGLVVVTVGGADESVDFGIDSYSSQGNLNYKESNSKAWDAEFDTLYFTGNLGKMKLEPKAESSIKEVAVSHNKGNSWSVLKGDKGTYTADIVDGNNIIRVTTESGVAYQVVRGGKITTSVTEISGFSDGDGLLEAGEGVRITLEGLHTPIPKMAGNYNPGYKQNLEGDGGVHLVYTFLGDSIKSDSVQYTFGQEGNSVEITIPENYEEKTISLEDGYISLGVVGLSDFANKGDSHRNIPDVGCVTRDSKTTFHTRSILPKITLTIGEMASPNTAPTVKEDAVTEDTIKLGQNYAINPERLFTDKDGDVLTYQISINGATAETITADYKFTPSEAGIYELTFIADDGEAQTSHTILLTVKLEETPEEDKDIVFDIKEEEIAGYVVVSFEDYGVREKGATGLKYPVPLGSIIEPTKVPYKSGDSVAAVTVRLLNAMDIGYTCSGTVESSFYLSSIKNFEVNNTPYDEMGEFHAGSGSGWMITLNDVFINKGASEFVVKDNDIVKWQYTCQLGADIGDNYSEELIRKVEKLIDDIGTVTEDSKESIEAARQAYEELNDLQKKAVKNYDVLVAAEKAYAELIATEKDKKAAQKVESLIDAIGDVTLDSEEKIKAARNAYDNLTDIQKQLVGNYDILVKAENMLNHLKNPSHENIYKVTGDYLESLGTPYCGAIGGDWMALGLARSERTVPKGYYNHVVSYVKENINDEGQLHWFKSTENSRVILGLTSAGYDPTDVEGHNLLKALNNMEYVKKQGINGPIWALIAFDSYDYKIPKGGDVTREKLIQSILDAQLKDGGWTLSGTISDTDMTGMALQALAPYYNKNNEVKNAVDQALTYLSKIQNEDGSFSGIDGVSTESMAQIIVALTSLDINPETDSRFVKNGLSVIDALCDLAVQGGGFRHVKGGDLDGMATEQGYYALTAYIRFLNGQTSLYDMSDVEINAENPPYVEEDTLEEKEDTSVIESEETDKEASGKTKSFNNKKEKTKRKESKEKSEEDIEEYEATAVLTDDVVEENEPEFPWIWICVGILGVTALIIVAVKKKKEEEE